MNEEIEKIKSRLEQVEEQVFSSQNNSKISKKIGKLQTKIRELSGNIDTNREGIERNKNNIERLTAEEKLLEDMKSLRTQYEKEIERMKNDVEEDIQSQMDNLERKETELEKLMDHSSDHIDDWENYLDTLQDIQKDIERSSIINKERYGATLRLMNAALSTDYLPQEDDVFSMVWEKIGAIERIESQEKVNELVAMISKWMKYVDQGVFEKVTDDPREDARCFAGFLAFKRLEKKLEEDNIDLDQMMEESDSMEEAFSGVNGSKLDAAFHEIVGDRSLEEIPNIDLIDSPIVLHAMLLEDSKIEENLEWFDDYFELQGEEEKIEETLSDVREGLHEH